MGSSASFVLLILVVVFLVFLLGRRKLSRITSLRIKGLVTFADTPVELNYDNVVGATGNFSISNLIGAGGFGSTYRAELAPGFLLAVKRLSIGRFQGIQQFDAEIRTLGRLQHKNMVTLIGYYVGEEEMFLVYNYLSGGNLETFIHEKSGSLVKWHVIYKIAINIADALAFLHNSCVPRIVHRDIKPSNILLDEELNAYISGSTVMIATMLVPQMGGGSGDKARVIQSLLFMFGLNTLLQTFLGTRLLTVMGPSFAQQKV
ncbi:hypothetical protein POM88_044655 [Heracleum sosnowskyi]|uniref:non-specific serine/threonine protein kinase n=1 Tax=Heracleum sosnowskyi TaxID=360622 RepID=A0AAD8M459_9APIA|nr:hypothetical protein POM88_044655 [Heracleum sosnowskyi]